ncbi:helix-turn-helix domain-containing protein [Streptomyces griseoflavus]|uniref:helix-turn-helix domain-containing protein n=1 Tax=Streptomyces griseoflavus TaxID=35619 RepID=UPI00167E73CA|nr:helix-turn-helix domain-containing protein [Streptomyces griseoflavus]
MSITRDVGAVQLGHRLAQLRERTGMKQAELARQVAWSQAVLSRIEAGERAVADDELQSLLAAIGTQEALELAATLERAWKHLPRPALDHPDQDLLWEAEQRAVSLVELSVAPHAHPAFQQRLKEYVDEICHRAERLLRRQHRIAFIGNIGIGKSTAICRASALEVPGRHGRPVPVLEAGAGGVTLCEVHLGTGPGYGVIVVPRTHDDIRADVTDFVDRLLQANHTSTESIDDETVHVPREIERAIRNMAGLQRKKSRDAEGKRTDPAKTLAAETSSKRDLVVEVLTRMGLHRRDRREEWFQPSLTSNPLEWMKGTFEQINNGRHPEFSLPARIDLIVPNLVQIEDLEISMIDTRGIDHLTARADLESHLEDPHTVAILCSGFNEAPAPSVQHLLKRAREIDNRQIESNCGVLVLPRPEEAAAVKDESGLLVESNEEGYELKQEQVSAALNSYRLSDLPIDFFNSFEDDPVRLQDFLRGRVLHTRGVFKRQLRDVLVQAQSLLDNVEKEQVQEIQREAGRQLSIWIDLNSAPAKFGGHVHDNLLEEIDSAHVSTVNAAVRREGEWRSLSYSHQLGHGARRLTVEALQDLVTGFTSTNEMLCASHPEAEELLSQASRLLTAAYEELLRRIQLASVTLYREQLKQDPRLWRDSAEEWGKGSGYRNRILDHNRKWFQHAARQELEVQLEAMLAREWTGLLARVRAIFEGA